MEESWTGEERKGGKGLCGCGYRKGKEGTHSLNERERKAGERGLRGHTLQY